MAARRSMSTEHFFGRSEPLVPVPRGAVVATAQDGSLYLHFQACGDQRVSAVDFGQGGEIIACCEWPHCAWHALSCEHE